VLTSKALQNVDGLVVCYSTDGWIGVLIALQASMVHGAWPTQLALHRGGTYHDQDTKA